MRILAKPLGLLLGLIYGFVGNYGLTVVIFTLIVKFCLYPLYANQIKNSATMAEIQPKEQAIRQKYKDDQEMLNQKIQELYEKENYSPMKGCLPLIIQMPIIFGLFALLRNPILYMGDSTDMILAVHESFLWIKDLSQPDVWVLPIAAGLSTFISYAQTSAQTNTPQQNPSMKIMQYIFPVMIVLMGRQFPAGLTIYWFLNTALQILFNLRFAKIRKKARAEAELKKQKQKKDKK